MFNYWTEGGFIAWDRTRPNTGKTPLQLFMDGRAQAAYDPTISYSGKYNGGGPYFASARARGEEPIIKNSTMG